MVKKRRSTSRDKKGRKYRRARKKAIKGSVEQFKREMSDYKKYDHFLDIAVGFYAAYLKGLIPKEVAAERIKEIGYEIAREMKSDKYKINIYKDIAVLEEAIMNDIPFVPENKPPSVDEFYGLNELEDS